MRASTCFGAKVSAADLVGDYYLAICCCYIKLSEFKYIYQLFGHELMATIVPSKKST
jgi:hypothetical protein